MKKFNYKITRNEGIHARPAGELVNFTKKFDNNIKITINFNKKCANAKKLFDIMSLCMKQGDTIKFIIESSDKENSEAHEEAVMAKILNFFDEKPW